MRIEAKQYTVQATVPLNNVLLLSSGLVHRIDTEFCRNIVFDPDRELYRIVPDAVKR